MNTRIFEDKNQLAKAFSEDLMELINGKDSVHIALSGGSTPKVIFDYVASNFSDQIKWDNAHFYWGDERCVVPTDDQSNYKMTVDHLFSKINIPESNIHRVHGEQDPVGEAERYGQLIESNLPSDFDVPVFDLVILGMGDDGHTASIFPHQMELFNSENNCEVAEHPYSGQKRITITGKIINAAQNVAFLVTGANKQQKLREIFEKSTGYESYPAAHVSPLSKQLTWFLDKSAAEGMDLYKV